MTHFGRTDYSRNMNFTLTANSAAFDNGGPLLWQLNSSGGTSQLGPIAAVQVNIVGLPSVAPDKAETALKVIAGDGGDLTNFQTDAGNGGDIVLTAGRGGNSPSYLGVGRGGDILLAPGRGGSGQGVVGPMGFVQVNGNFRIVDLDGGGSFFYLDVKSQTVGFFNHSVTQQESASLTNNVQPGGTDDVIVDMPSPNWNTVRNNFYQLARKLKEVSDALHNYGLLK